MVFARLPCRHRLSGLLVSFSFGGLSRTWNGRRVGNARGYGARHLLHPGALRRGATPTAPARTDDNGTVVGVETPPVFRQTAPASVRPRGLVPTAPASSC